HSLTQPSNAGTAPRNGAHLTTHHRRVGGTHLEQKNTSYLADEQRDKMSSYVSSECRRVSPSVHGNKFDTAHRKKAVANIFENVNQDALMRLFQKTGDMKAEERVRSIFSYTQDPEETARALMALKQRKKDKFLQIAGMIRQLLKLR
ncbi:Protein C8orf4-like protein, partial [Nibea albiflora]